MKVTCTELLNTTSRTAYYRVYVAGNWTVLHYGGIGKAGTWGATNHGFPGNAESAGYKLIDSKLGSYYQTGTVTFDYPHAIDVNDKPGLARLDTFRLGAVSSSLATASQGPAPVAKNPGAPRPTAPKPIPPSLHVGFNERALAAIALATTDRTEAMVELAILTEQFTELELVHARAVSYLATLKTMVMGTPMVVSL